MRKSSLKIGLIQPKVSADAATNQKNALGLVRRAAKKGARIVCLPELYRSLYFPQKPGADAKALTESIPGESTRAFARLARELGIVVIVPLFERAEDGTLYNSAAVLDADGSLLGAYRKVHIPHDPGFYEQNYFTPSPDGFQVFKTRHASFSVLICYDQWFPEAARLCALKGADIIFYPTAIGAVDGLKQVEGDWRQAWVSIQRSHAIANGVHVAACNRVGREGKTRFWGTSFVSDAFGKVIKAAGTAHEEVLVAEVDLTQNSLVREGWGFFRNRRPELYGELAR